MRVGANDCEPRGVGVVVELGEAGERPVNEGKEVREGRAGVGDSVSIIEGVFVAVGPK